LNRHGKTIIMVTHEPEVGEQTRRILRLRDGLLSSDKRLAPPVGADAPVE
jgi:putative ABC transport system ATP-binding protein